MIIIGQVSGKDVLEQVFEATFEEGMEFEQNYQIRPGEHASLITSGSLHVFNSLKYGLIPFWQKSAKIYPYAPVDGDTIHETDDHGLKKRIITSPYFRKPIREQRCIIPADYFILTNEARAYLFFLPNRPFAIAGVYDTWKRNIKDIDLYTGFAPITLPATKLYTQVGFTRLPLILPENRWKQWLMRDTPLTDITNMIDHYPEKFVNGYPVSQKLVMQSVNSQSVVVATGDYLKPVEEFNPGKLVGFLRSFRYKRGLTHEQEKNEERIWRGGDTVK